MNIIYPENYILSPYENKYELRWNIPADNGEYINMYEVKYCIVRRRENTWSETGSGCETLELKSSDQASVELSNLFADTFYKVELRAHNSIGYSTPGQIILKTARDPSTIESPLYSSRSLRTSCASAITLSSLLLVIYLSLLS
ncbi:fasciclin-2-like [Diaphorina citri]|uniref:Fasciclin-2-like n=1 Tax=Diaphorina citri TaxID=121845 RepID=A0A1S4E6T0_DIACI|nr:fasciclin-2-like [Diaphorina citri]